MFRVLDFGFWFLGLGFMAWDLSFGVKGLGFRVGGLSGWRFII